MDIERRGLSLHDLKEFIKMEEDSGFAYKVLMGDASAVESTDPTCRT